MLVGYRWVMRSIPAALAPTALAHEELAIPGDELPPGPTRELRRAMARFCDGAAHAAARGRVVDVVDELDEERVAAIARRRTRSLIATGRTEAVPALVPAGSLAEVLGVISPDDDGARLVELLVLVGDTIVAGSVDEAEADTVDAATAELADLVAGRGDPVALLSILHQTRGATGALIATMLEGTTPRRSAVPATKRTATSDVVLDGFGPITAGETVAVELDLDTEFGHGRHACPGRRLAEAVSATVISALDG